MTDIPDDVVERTWRDLCEKSDRTSPVEYPDMALITLDELRAAGRVFVEWALKQPTGCVSSDIATNGGNVFRSRSTDREE